MRNEATWNVRRLQAAYQYERFTSPGELRQLVNELPAYRRQEMTKNKKIKDLMDVGIVPPTPAEIIKREEALKAAVDSFQYAKFSGTAWEIDTEAMEDAADRFRKYITEDWQFQLYEKEQKLARILNEIPMGENSRMRNWQSNEFVVYNAKLGKWEPNTTSLFVPGLFKA